MSENIITIKSKYGIPIYFKQRDTTYDMQAFGKVFFGLTHVYRNIKCETENLDISESMTTITFYNEDEV